jgi:ketosteroid isomerase-like protein
MDEVMNPPRETNREIWLKVIKAWAEEDVETISRYVSPDMEILEPASLPYPGLFKGPQGYIDLHRKIESVWADLKVDRGMVIGGEDEDALVIEYFTTATCRATGKQMDREPSLGVWKFRDGMVISMTPFNFDTAKIVSLL